MAITTSPKASATPTLADDAAREIIGDDGPGSDEHEGEGTEGLGDELTLEHHAGTLARPIGCRTLVHHFAARRTRATAR